MQKIKGLIAATYTPMRPDGSLHLEQVPLLVEHLIGDGVAGLYVCGSTGEGMSLTGGERRAVAEAYVSAAGRRVPVIVQVGHNSLAEAQGLAVHAQQIGAAAVSATCPSYFKVDCAEVLVDCMAQVASGAPDLPFYYYHIPALTGSPIDMVEFLGRASSGIPTLVGLKFTTPDIHVYQLCLELDDGRFDVLWGMDEMLLSALVAGARGCVGSTYNMAAPLYRRIIDAHDRGDLIEAARLQSLAVRMIRTMQAYPFHAAMKEVLKVLGFDCGRCRLPQRSLSPGDAAMLRQELEAMGFFDWSRNSRAALPVEHTER